MKTIGGLWDVAYLVPEGEGGPFLYRLNFYDRPGDAQPKEYWLYDGDSYYFVEVAKHRAHLTNVGFIFCGLHAQTLPTDSEAFSALLLQFEGRGTHAMIDRESFQFQRDPGTRRVTLQRDMREGEDKPFDTTFDYGPQPPDHFRFNAEGLTVADERDEVHRQGWAYFQIEGSLEGRAVHGVGRMPFVLNAARRHPPYLRVRIEGGPTLVDDGRVAAIVGPGGRIQRIFEGGAFFQGLPRTWTGFRALDTMRRDAVSEFVWAPYDQANESAIVLEALQDHRFYQLKYRVNTGLDLLESIEFRAGEHITNTSLIGDWRFSYSVQLPAGERLDAIETAGNHGPAPESPTVYWPLALLGVDVPTERIETTVSGVRAAAGMSLAE
jgi:hypothetical protein